MWEQCDVLAYMLNGGTDMSRKVLEFLLQDKTTDKNIRLDDEELTIEKVIDDYKNNNGFVTRSKKSKELKKARTKQKAEVFTPIWIVAKQNDAVDANYINDDIDTYVCRTWLEITCGEGPYITTRYDMEDGSYVQLPDRKGFLDRKLERINKEVNDAELWVNYVIKALQSSYGFEWAGDSLYLCRLNILATVMDYYYAKFDLWPNELMIDKITSVIVYNFFQMDGLKYVVPNTDIRTKVMDWSDNTFDYFDKDIEKPEPKKKKGRVKK